MPKFMRFFNRKFSSISYKNFNLDKIHSAHNNMKNLVVNTPLEKNIRLSKKYNSHIFIKREDLQQVRSFKIRGAFNKLTNLSKTEKENGIVCASAGNHAQGVALSSKSIDISSDIFIPETTPVQKVTQISNFLNDKSKIHMIGSNFNECLEYSLDFTKKNNKSFIHPYNDIDTIIGQATIAKEIYERSDPDFILGTIGGGGLMAGCSTYSRYIKPSCEIIGVEPATCPSMKLSIERNELIELDITDNFVDGATVSKVGDITFEICKKNIDKIYDVSIGKLCETMLELYQNDGIIAEPAGALPIAALDKIKDKIENKIVICILSGGNNDLTRYPEIIERQLRYKKLKHYYIIQFGQKPGELRKFINNVLGSDDDITRFEYIKKTNRNFGNVLIGIELKKAEDINLISQNLKKNNFKYTKIEEDDLIYSYIV